MESNNFIHVYSIEEGRDTGQYVYTYVVTSKETLKIYLN